MEALKDFHVVNVACGSGDAQTMCLTDDDSVWSWGDGDYGKLGRGGSDGCKVPMRIDALQGMGVIKVDCGSQFSVALTKSGAVYTWLEQQKAVELLNIIKHGLVTDEAGCKFKLSEYRWFV